MDKCCSLVTNWHILLTNSLLFTADNTAEHCPPSHVLWYVHSSKTMQSDLMNIFQKCSNIQGVSHIKVHQWLHASALFQVLWPANSFLLLGNMTNPTMIQLSHLLYPGVWLTLPLCPATVVQGRVEYDVASITAMNIMWHYLPVQNIPTVNNYKGSTCSYVRDCLWILW